MKMKYLGLAIAVMVMAGTMRADSFFGTGDLSITGNSACGGTCAESIAFTIHIMVPTYKGALPEPEAFGSVTSATGPLGSSFTVSPWLNFSGNAFVVPGVPFDLEFTDSGGDVIFVEGYVVLNLDGSVRETPVIVGSFFWDCETATCVTEFVPPSSPASPPNYRGFDLLGTAGGTIANVPEPSSLGLVMITAMAMAIMLVVKKSRCSKA